MDVEVILRSVCAGGPPITTFKLRYWRPIHAELMTHRVFSRNASSSRAVPVEKLAESAVDDMFIPTFRKNKPGMQPGDYLSNEEQEEASVIWRNAAFQCYQAAKKLSDKDGLNVHKQWANRMLEWFGYINVLVTATDWDNFFDLRMETNVDGSPVPQDEMYNLAEAMYSAIKFATTTELKPNEWHLPFITNMEREKYDDAEMRKISAARCASISYETVDGQPMTPSKAVALCDKLLLKKHYSPFEHQAMADQKIDGFWSHGALHANYTGWAQWRHFLMEQSR